MTPGKTVLEELEAVFAPVVAMEAQLRETEQQMAHAAEDPGAPCASWATSMTS